MGIRWRHIDKTGKCTTYCYLCSDSSIQRNAWRNANACRPIIINLSKSVSSYTWTYAHACNFTNACDNGLQISSEAEGFTKNRVDTPEAKPCFPCCNVMILWSGNHTSGLPSCLHQTFRSLKKTQAKCDFSCVGQILVQESTLAKSQMWVKSAEVARWMGTAT